MNDKYITYFNDFYLYDASIKYINNIQQIYVDKIKVIAEVLLEGAIETIYEVQYQDGTKAYVAKNMYSITKENAHSKLVKEFDLKISNIKDIIATHTKELNELNQQIEHIKKYNYD